MKQKKKRILSLLLSLVLMISLLPTMPVFAKTTTFVYNFNPKATDAQGVTGVTPIKDYSDYTSERNWKFHEMSSAADTEYEGKADGDKRKIAGFDGNALVFSTKQDNDWIAFKIKVPEPGEYSVTYDIRTRDSYCKRGFLSILPATVTDVTYNACITNEGCMTDDIVYNSTSSTTADKTDCNDITKKLVVNTANEEFIMVLGYVEGNDTVVFRSLKLIKETEDSEQEEPVLPPMTQKITFGESAPQGIVVNTNASERYTVEIADKMLNAEIQCRAMVASMVSGYAAYIAIPFTAESTGVFDIYLRNHKPTNTSADAAIFIIEDTGINKSERYPDATLSTGAVQPAYFFGDDYEAVRASANGRFNFGNITAGKYTAAKKNGANATASLVRGKKYFFILLCDDTSRTNSPIAYVAGKPGETVNITEGSVLSTYRQTLSLSGIQLVPQGEEVADENDIRILGKAELSLDAAETFPATFVSTTLKVFDTAGEAFDSDDISVTYSSSDTSVATVDENGVIRAKTLGETEITATATYNGVAMTSSAKLTVILRPSEGVLPDVIGSRFGSEVIHVGETISVEVTDMNGKPLGNDVYYEYDIADEAVLSENDGTFKALAPGRTTVKITAFLGETVRETECVAIVVGKNLLTKSWKETDESKAVTVKHGEFGNSIYLSDTSNNVEQKHTYWRSTRNETTYNYDFELLRNTISDVTGEKTNVAAFTAKGIGSSNRVVVQGFKRQYYKATDQRGYTDAEADKLYEFSGYIKADDVNKTPVANMRMYYYNGRATTSVSLKSILTTPWSGKSGPQDWTFFTVPALLLNYGYRDIYGAMPYIDFQSIEQGGKVSISHLSLHEVAFDRAEFAIAELPANIKAGDTVKTTLSLYSNTGNPITVGSTDVPLDAVYTTSDPSVASVSNDGTVTVIKNGECEIGVTVTVCGVKKTASVDINFSGIETVLSKLEAIADVTTLSVGETANAVLTAFNNDGTEFDGEYEVWYESEDSRVANISQEGVITAKRAGTVKITAWIKSGDTELGDSFDITVIDSSPLSKAVISGDDRVEAGFSGKLTAEAFHENGFPADISACTVTFALENPEDEQYLKVSPDGTVTGVSEGRANVVATVVSERNSVMSEAFEIEVIPLSPKNKVIDFRSRTIGFAHNATIKENGWEINVDKTATLVGTVPSSKLNCTYYALISQIKEVGNTREADTAIDIWVDYDGWYDIDFAGRQQYRGAALAYLYMDGNFLGEYCFFGDQENIGTTYVEGPVASLNSMYLTKGRHTFIIRSVTSADYERQFPSYITLKYVDGNSGIDSVEIICDRNELAMGESVAIVAKAMMTSGREYVFGLMHGNAEDKENYVILESSDSGILEIKNGKAYAKALGEVTVIARAVIGSAEKESTVKLTVNPDLHLADFEFAKEQYNVYKDSPVTLNVNAYLSNDIKISNEDLIVNYTVGDTAIARIESGKLVPVSEGSTSVTAEVTFGGVSLTRTVQVNVIADGFATVEVFAVSKTLKANTGETSLSVKLYDNHGNELTSDGAHVAYRSGDNTVAEVSGNGKVTAKVAGTVKLFADVTLDGITQTGEIEITVRNGKVKSTYYTENRVGNARENIQKYKWAKQEKDAVVEKADKYLPQVDYIYNNIPAHTIERLQGFVDRDNPLLNCCLYCGTDLGEKGGKYSWIEDQMTRLWKIQCSQCKRIFPSNDFESFYKNGLDERGEFDYTLARENNGILCERGYRNESGKYIVYDEYADNPYGYGDPNGNLYNETYTELYSTGLDPRTNEPITQGWISDSAAKEQGVGYFWGVDDSLGYDTGTEYLPGRPQKFRYIGVICERGFWYSGSSIVYESINAFRDAYVYTGDRKYAIAGAKILDRIADLYPDYDRETDDHDKAGTADSSEVVGRILHRIWENFLIQSFSKAYDAFFDIYDDSEVIEYLSGYAEKWNLENKKTNGELIRQNFEENYLMDAYNGIRNGRVHGNFGMKQNSLAYIGVVLDREPESREIIEFAYQQGEIFKALCTGGNMRPAIINDIDRDGMGNESSLGYLGLWNSQFMQFADTLSEYEGIPDEDNLYKNPKFYKMLLQGADMILAGVRMPNIGDNSAGFARTGVDDNRSWWLNGFKATGNPKFAQLLWYITDGNLEGIHYDIFTKDPEEGIDAIKEAIEEHGELPLSDSSILTGYGFAALRDGVLYNKTTTGTQENTMRDWWMYFGGAATTHKHMDALNLGLDAFGLNMAPDLGYQSSSASGDDHASTWIEGTASHNTVIVNDTQQTRNSVTGYPYHFDDAGSVKVMDVDVPQAYPGVTDTYRRTLISVDVDDSVSYALDLFRIVGGNEHVYSFHSQSVESTLDGVKLVAQPRGTYAGVNFPYGSTEYTGSNGYEWIRDVERAEYPGTGEFSIDFKIVDWKKFLPGKRNLHLKLTQLNDFELSEVAKAKARPVPNVANPELIDYLFVRRSGENLDTLFTTVIEPYENSSKIKNLSRVAVRRTDGKTLRDNEPVVAVKVELVNGRTDYIVYATNNEIEYDIGGVFSFKGFVGVYSHESQNKENVVRTYLHDGTLMGNIVTDTSSAATGEVVSFTKTLEFENFIEVTMKENVDLQTLVGKMIVVDNDGGQNGSYVIKSAEKKGDNVLIGTGDVTLIRSLTEDGSDYVMNIAEGDAYRIPLTHTTDNAPEISVSGEYTTSAGSSISIPLSVTSDREYTLSGTMLPRGMSLNAETGVLTWRPDASQVGDNHVAVTVNNGVLSDTVHFIVTVYGSTTGGSSENNEENDAGTTEPVTPPADGGGGGGGGGGAAPTEPDDTANTDEKDNADGTNNTDVGNGVYDVPSFTDLANYTWAEDAIDALAADGIIRGTSESTFSPANNITRADFALLLVRAFNITSDNTENFADVSASDYFAAELAIARNTGLVGGIGENKFAPRNSITRQDMMVIVYRALTTINVNDTINSIGEGGLILPSTDEVSYADFTNVADYAKKAVSALVNAGIVNGKNGKIAPLDYTTRAEVAVLIKRILDYTAR